jgi:hypothetical protein
MKKLLGLSVVSLAVSLVSIQEASAWKNIKFGVGLNLQYQTANNALGKHWTNGQVPGYPTTAFNPYYMHGMGYPAGYNQGHDQGFGHGYGHAAPYTAPMPTPVPPAGEQADVTPVQFYRPGYDANYYTPTYYPSSYYYGYGYGY